MSCNNNYSGIEIIIIKIIFHLYYLTISQSVPQDESGILWAFIISNNCCLTSLAFLIAFGWIKCCTHQLSRYLLIMIIKKKKKIKKNYKK